MRSYQRLFTEAELPQVIQELREWAPTASRWLLVGPLGAGKTRLVRSWIGETASSPTFTYIHYYPSAVHIDLYRFPVDSPTRWAEVYEALEEAPLIFVEWADKLPFPPPLPAVWVEVSPLSETVRKLTATLKE